MTHYTNILNFKHSVSFPAIFASMSHAPSLAGVILAAGESSRMGRDKALLPWPPSATGQPTPKGNFLSATIASLAFSTDFVVVVAGENTALLAPVAYAHGASLVTNPEPSRGQFSSLQIGLREVLNRGRDSAVITLVDRPPVSSATVKFLREAFESADHNIWAVVPEYAGRHGHPFVAGRELIEAFLQAPATSSARELERRYQDRIQYTPVDDPFVTLNINTPEDYASLLTQI
jgi:molybdenum cofactor cytidylyltransferase